ncbi:MAG: hypothetical protein LC114_09075 [Bryobacterales bacterium]|nr:hypothetical protein [Bryobacterales bacterium]
MIESQLANTIVTIAIAVIAVAVAIQAISAVVAAIAASKMKAAVSEIQSQVKPIAERAMEVLDQTRTVVASLQTRVEPLLTDAAHVVAQAKGVTEKANAIMARGQSQAENLDAALTDTVQRVRLQLGNVEHTMDHVLHGVRSTADQMNSGILAPIRKANGLVNGVAAAVGFLMQGRTTVSRATHDDEMFI